MIQYIMLFHIRAVLDLVKLIQAFLQPVSVKILQCPLEHFRRTAGILCAGDEIIKIK